MWILSLLQLATYNWLKSIQWMISYKIAMQLNDLTVYRIAYVSNTYQSKTIAKVQCNFNRETWFASSFGPRSSRRFRTVNLCVGDGVVEKRGRWHFCTSCASQFALHYLVLMSWLVLQKLLQMRTTLIWAKPPLPLGPQPKNGIVFLLRNRKNS